MKLYKIRGTSEWVPWSVLYNERGYNSVPCIDMAFKSISPWGTSAGTGYRTNGTGDVTYFVSGKTGWYLAFNLPQAFGMYPAEATPIQMIKDGVVSDAVWMEFWGAKWYLIQAEIVNERYWIHELALPEYGWEIYEGKDYEFILVDGTTGRIVHGVEQLNEMVFAPTGYFTIEDTGDVVFVEQSPYPIVSRFHVDFDTVQTLADGAYIDTVLPYYTSKLYIAGIVDRVAETVVDFGLTVSNEGGYVRVTNNTGASVTLTRLAIQSMDATGAEVVEVVDGQDNHAYAFKWNDGGTPYWWISYSGERHWTDALGNWSEVPSVVLPTVNQKNDLSHRFRFNRDGNDYTFSNNGTTSVYSDSATNPTFVDWDSTKVYGVIKYWNSDETQIGRQGITPIEAPDWGEAGKVYMKNESGNALTVAKIRTATCDNLSAIVITVYDSQNTAYNAFKFTASGTDYYYVLDGTQTDWTDDLSSIGYRLDMQFYFYFSMNNDNPVDVTFDYPSGSNYWGLRIQNQSDKDILDSLGLFAATQYPASAPYGYLKAHTAQTSFSYELKAIFLPDDTQAPFSLSDFYCYAYNSIECVVCSGSYSTPVRSCMISIKPIS